jgi:hypothetical protein
MDYPHRPQAYSVRSFVVVCYVSMEKPVNCRYFYGDYFRGKEKEACRLLAASPDNTRSWRRALCNSCPVPALVMASNSRELVLEAQITRKLLREQVEVTFAVCAKHLLELKDPMYCPLCAEEADA